MIGLALFAYLRMLCGADTLKADLRVAAALQRAGLPLADNADTGTIAIAAQLTAAALGVRLIHLDQLPLWDQAPDRPMM